MQPHHSELSEALAQPMDSGIRTVRCFNEAGMRVAVLGAGFQGTCVALELARRGIKVDLYDQNEACLTQAGSRNEGKIHLGFVYAKDGDFETAKLMARGGLAFGRAVQQWVECDMACVGGSQPFDYVVHRDSLVPADQIKFHFAKVIELVHELAAGTGARYLGEDLRERRVVLSTPQTPTIQKSPLPSLPPPNARST
jgi:hypothetical protein